MNKLWHDANRLAPKAKLEERLTWHLEHAKACGCRDMPASIKTVLTERGIELPPRPTKG